MSFTVGDFEDLYRLLAEHPEWRDRLRPLILGDEFLAVPGRLERIETLLERMAERQAVFEEHQARFEENQARFEERQAVFEEHQARFEENQARFEERQAVFEENQARFEERQAAFEERQARFEERLDALTAQVQELARISSEQGQRQNRMDGRMGNIEGMLMQNGYLLRLDAWLGKYARRPRPVSLFDLERLQAAIEAGSVSDEEVERLEALDLLLEGRSRTDGSELLVVAEISLTINEDDVARVNRAAETLRRVGYQVVAVVGGSAVSDAAAATAEQSGTRVDLRRLVAA